MNLYIDGKITTVGSRIKDFRGDEWTFGMIVQAPQPGKSGKIEVLSVPHGHSRVFYPSVFGGTIKS